MTKDELENAVNNMIWNPRHYMFLGGCDNPRYREVWTELSQLQLGITIYPARALTCMRKNGEDPYFSLAKGERLVVRRITQDAVGVERPERPDWAGRLHALCPCALFFMKCQPEYARN